MGKFDADEYFYKVRVTIFILSMIMAGVPAFGIGGIEEVYNSKEGFCGYLLAKDHSLPI